MNVLVIEDDPTVGGFIRRGLEEQRYRVEELARDGHDTESAMRLLTTLERTLEIMREHLALEERLASEV